jgi:hypothetical protein
MVAGMDGVVPVPREPLSPDGLTYAGLSKLLVAGAAVSYVAGRMPRVPRQTNGCWSCGDRWGYAWDHCHAHGLVRGFLCGRCNLVFAELDGGRTTYFVTADDEQRHARWLRRCGSCPPADCCAAST